MAQFFSVYSTVVIDSLEGMDRIKVFFGTNLAKDWTLSCQEVRYDYQFNSTWLSADGEFPGKKFQLFRGTYTACKKVIVNEVTYSYVLSPFYKSS